MTHANSILTRHKAKMDYSAQRRISLKFNISAKIWNVSIDESGIQIVFFIEENLGKNSHDSVPVQRFHFNRLPN